MTIARDYSFPFTTCADTPANPTGLDLLDDSLRSLHGRAIVHLKFRVVDQKHDYDNASQHEYLKTDSTQRDQSENPELSEVPSLGNKDERCSWRGIVKRYNRDCGRRTG